MSADLAIAVAADDLLLDVLGSATPDMCAALADDELCALLSAWRHEIEARPINTTHKGAAA